MVMQIVLLVISSLLTALFVFLLFKGKEFESYLEVLDSAEYPIKDLYVAGYALSGTKLFSLKGKIKDRLMADTNLMYGQHYSEYYANLIWAQALTFVHFFLCIAFLASAMLGSGSVLILIIGVAFSFYCGYYWLTKTKADLTKRQASCESELPEIVSSLALLINSGMTLVDAWNTVAFSKNGIVGQLMQDTCADMKNGTSAQEAIHKFGIVSSSNEIKKFTSSLAQGMQKGSEEIGQFLMDQAQEQWAFKKQRMIQKGEVAASEMLIPTTLIFAGVLVIIISTALGGSFL